MDGPNYQVIKAQRFGQPVLIVIDASLDPEAHASAFPWLLTVRVAMRFVDFTGLCSRSESGRLDEVEDRLLEALTTDQHRYVGHVTGNGNREVLMYVNDPETVVERLNKALPATGEDSVEIERQHDPRWEYYRQFPR